MIEEGWRKVKDIWWVCLTIGAACVERRGVRLGFYRRREEGCSTLVFGFLDCSCDFPRVKERNLGPSRETVA